MCIAQMRSETKRSNETEQQITKLPKGCKKQLIRRHSALPRRSPLMQVNT